MLTVCSRAHQEEQEGQQHQVQGPLLEERLHPRPQGHRQGREAQAVASPGYALQYTLSGFCSNYSARSYHLRRWQEEPQGQARGRINASNMKMWE